MSKRERERERGRSFDEDVETKRIIDDFMNKVSNGKLRIEDFTGHMEEKEREIRYLVRHVIVEIVRINKKHDRWTREHGGYVDRHILRSNILYTITLFIRELLEAWDHVETHSMLKDLADKGATLKE